VNHQAPTEPSSPGPAPAPPTTNGAGEEPPAVTALHGVRALVQLGLLVGGLGVLGWCIVQALSNPEYAAQLSRLRDAGSWAIVGVLVVLSAISTSLSGLMFWAVLRPVKRLRAGDCVLVNAVTALLGYVPFKLSLAFRVLYHYRRDGMPLMLIGGWLAATGVVIVASLGPTLASLLRAEMDAAWWLIALGGTGAMSLAAVLAGRLLSTQAGWRFLMRLAAIPRFGWLERTASGRGARNLHEGTRMLASPGAVFGAVAMRLIDVIVQSARFALAARLLGVPMSTETAVLAGSVYFLLQAFSPAGSLGVREGGTLGVLSALQTQETLAVILVVSLASAISDTLYGLGAAAALRAHRLLAVHPTAPTSPAPPAPPAGSAP
jgi:hypothetical protein